MRIERSGFNHHLRTPEVFLDAPWEAGFDIWSLGLCRKCCSHARFSVIDVEKIYEIIQGSVLFRGRPGLKGC